MYINDEYKDKYHDKKKLNKACNSIDIAGDKDEKKGNGELRKDQGFIAKGVRKMDNQKLVNKGQVANVEQQIIDNKSEDDKQIRVDILLDIEHFSVCTYLSNDDLNIGDVVEVNFRNKKRFGIVIASPSKQEFKKNIKYKNVLNRSGIKFDSRIYEIIKYIARYYCASLGKIACLFINKYLKYKEIKCFDKALNNVLERLECVNIDLNENQNQVIEDLSLCKPNLIFGVTGSGKTEVYFHIIKEYIKLNKQVLILLPEINLASNIAERFKKRFGFDALVWHSKSLQKTKMINYLYKNYPVVVGTRSSLFLPYRNLSCIIVDEEHDLSYKQDSQVLYNARDMAVLFAAMMKIQICLFSATPTLESYYNAKNNKYNILHLNQQYSQIKLPEIQCIQFDAKEKKKSQQLKSSKAKEMEVNGKVQDERVQQSNNILSNDVIVAQDVKDSIVEKNNEVEQILHDQVLSKIWEKLDKQEQVMIYLNRKGYYRLVLCKQCAEEVKCKNCSIPLVWYQRKDCLYCHYCDSEFTLGCLTCDSNQSLKFYGLGIEQLYEYVVSIFGDKYKVEYVTSDAKNVSEIVDNFSTGKINIIVTTQIMAKGYHFSNLTLVVMLNMDLQTCPTNFRFNEHNMQMIYQVRGRCGREKDGEVILQSIKKRKDVLNYNEFLELELGQRKKYNLPPFYKMIGIIISGYDEKLVEKEAYEVLRYYMQTFENIMGPVESLIYKMNKLYRLRIFITMRKEVVFLGGYKVKFNSNNIKYDIDIYNFF